MTEMSAGRAVVELVKAEGVHHVFGIVGSTFLDVLDVLYDDKSVEYINVRHEQGAAFMADGLARVTGMPAVCLVTSGPGATNLLTGIASAYVGHSPVVAKRATIVRFSVAVRLRRKAPRATAASGANPAGGSAQYRDRRRRRLSHGMAVSMLRSRSPQQ